MKQTIFMLMLVMSFQAMLSQNCGDSLTTFQFHCGSSKMEIHVPCGYIEADFSDDDKGGAWEIEYADESAITILCGVDGKINIKKDRNSNLNYKKVFVKGYQVMYEDVPKDKVEIFEKAFALLEKDIKE